MVTVACWKVVQPTAIQVIALGAAVDGAFASIASTPVVGYITQHFFHYQRHRVILWLKSCTSWDVWNPINNGILYISTGAGFLPSTVWMAGKWCNFFWIGFLQPFYVYRVGGQIWERLDIFREIMANFTGKKKWEVSNLLFLNQRFWSRKSLLKWCEHGWFPDTPLAFQPALKMLSPFLVHWDIKTRSPEGI